MGIAEADETFRRSPHLKGIVRNHVHFSTNSMFSVRRRSRVDRGDSCGKFLAICLCFWNSPRNISEAQTHHHRRTKPVVFLWYR